MVCISGFTSNRDNNVSVHVGKNSCDVPVVIKAFLKWYFLKGNIPPAHEEKSYSNVEFVVHNCVFNYGITDGFLTLTSPLAIKHLHKMIGGEILKFYICF